MAWKRRGRPSLRIVRTLAVIALFALAAVAAALLDPLPGDLVGQAVAVDGDTIAIAGERVRLGGLDAPELDQTCRNADGAEWPCGIVAKDALASALEGEVTCRPEDRDLYRRIVAICRADGADVGEALVAAGLALADARYLRLEQDARNGRRGLWAGDFEAPRAWRERSQGEDGFGWLRGWFE